MEKKGKMLVFTGLYVCVKAKLTFVSFVFLFFCTFPLEASFFANLPYHVWREIGFVKFVFFFMTKESSQK